MMRLSKITPTKRGRLALFDATGEFLCSVDTETCYKHGLREGCELDAAALDSLQADSETRRAKDKALGYLSLRSYGSQELYQKLCLKFDEHSSAAAVAEMHRLGLLDDVAFARARARHLAGQNRSAREIEHRLRALGLGEQEIALAMEEVAPQSEGACLAVVNRHYRAKLAAGQREKVLAALARRGFSYSEARAAVNSVLDELRAEQTEEYEF